MGSIPLSVFEAERLSIESVPTSSDEARVLGLEQAGYGGFTAELHRADGGAVVVPIQAGDFHDPDMRRAIGDLLYAGWKRQQAVEAAGKKPPHMLATPHVCSVDDAPQAQQG